MRRILTQIEFKNNDVHFRVKDKDLLLKIQNTISDCLDVMHHNLDRGMANKKGVDIHVYRSLFEPEVTTKKVKSDEDESFIFDNVSGSIPKKVSIYAFNIRVVLPPPSRQQLQSDKKRNRDEEATTHVYAMSYNFKLQQKLNDLEGILSYTRGAPSGNSTATATASNAPPVRNPPDEEFDLERDGFEIVKRPENEGNPAKRYKERLNLNLLV